jgi:two-component system, NtrC family, response regulator HydG
MMNRILVIEDNETMLEGLLLSLDKQGYETIGAPGGEQGLKYFAAEKADLVVTDLKMEPIDGLKVLAEVKKIDDSIPVIIITAHGSIDAAVEAMKLGAFDFITKPFSPDEFRIKVGKAFEMRKMVRQVVRLSEENEYYRGREKERFPFENIIGESAAIMKVLDQIEKVAGGDSTVYIHGESGTGKELVARAIHHASQRQSGPFITVNCSAFVETLLESELFGHEKGAFTGAVRRKPGRFELAGGGSVFLDEIGDISQLIQVKLLRVLQEKQIERIGGTETIDVDCRVISATNKDLIAEVEEHRFREDLFYRLHIVPIEIPPLRNRREDIPLLAAHFTEKLNARLGKSFEGFSPEAMDMLMAHSWPGNVRELENLIEQTMVMTDGPVIEARDLPPFTRRVTSAGAAEIPEVGHNPLPEILDGMERRLIEDAYGKTGGNKTETARLLGIKTGALYYKLEKYGIE